MTTWMMRDGAAGLARTSAQHAVGATGRKASRGPATALALACIVALLGCTDVSAPGENVANPSYGEALTMPSCGTVLTTYDGTNAYSNGADSGTTSSCDGAGAYGYQYQCTELVMRYFKTKWGLFWWGNANQLLEDAPPATVDVYYNGDGAHPPVPGDMVVWTVGGGHVALVTSVQTDSIDIIEQNVVGDGTAVLPWDGANIGPRWNTWIPAGWAHAKVNGAPQDGGGGAGGGGAGGSSVSTGNSMDGMSGSSTSGSSSSGSMGVSWDCNNSAYDGNQYWTCSNGNLYECQSGVAKEQTCPMGCTSNPVGTNDTCTQSGGVSWDCNNSAYDGNQYWTCSNGNLYECQSGVAKEQTCPMGCTSNPVGTNDTCTQSGGVSWNCSSSAYNGNQYWTCSNGNLYECQNGVAKEQTCPMGCTSNPVGTNDTCTQQQQVSWDCNNSAYDGSQYWTCSNGNLYECPNGTTPAEQTCPSGCMSNGLGTNDTCL